MYIIVGLGNPGREYADTRHNMGFMALDILAARHNIDIRKENFRSVYGEGRIGTERVILAKPLTFMNNSGWAVRDLVNWFKIEHDQLIVIYDDIDLDPGDLRIREKGSSGSHNGMKSVIYQLGFDDFPRIRVGVGAPEGGRDLIAHVMSMPTGEALDKVKAALNDAADAAELMVSGRIADAQMRFNKKPKRKKKEEAKKAVEAGYWPLYRYNPDLAKEGKNPFTLDSKPAKTDYKDFIMGEVRYASLKKLFPAVADQLFDRAEKEAENKYEYYKKLSELD